MEEVLVVVAADVGVLDGVAVPTEGTDVRWPVGEAGRLLQHREAARGRRPVAVEVGPRCRAPPPAAALSQL